MPNYELMRQEVARATPEEVQRTGSVSVLNLPHGCTMSLDISKVDSERVIKIDWIGVPPDFQDQHIGSVAFNKFLETALSYPVDKLEMLCQNPRVLAILRHRFEEDQFSFGEVADLHGDEINYLPLSLDEAIMSVGREEIVNRQRYTFTGEGVDDLGLWVSIDLNKRSEQ